MSAQAIQGFSHHNGRNWVGFRSAATVWPKEYGTLGRSTHFAIGAVHSIQAEVLRLLTAASHLRAIQTFYAYAETRALDVDETIGLPA